MKKLCIAKPFIPPIPGCFALLRNSETEKPIALDSLSATDVRSVKVNIDSPKWN